MDTTKVLDEVRAERARQDEKWGVQDHPDDDPTAWWYNSRDRGARERRAAELEVPSEHRAQFLTESAARMRAVTWGHILVEELAEAVDAIGDSSALRAELIQVAAVAVAWIEAIDRRLE